MGFLSKGFKQPPEISKIVDGLGNSRRVYSKGNKHNWSIDVNGILVMICGTDTDPETETIKFIRKSFT